MMSGELPTVAELPVLRGRLLGSIPGVVHGFSRRESGLGRAEGNVGYSAPRDKADAWAMRQVWSAAIGVEAEKIVTVGQIHGNVVHRATPADAGLGARPDSGRLGFGDALIAEQPGTVLFSLHADCLPLLLVDPGDRWRGPKVAAVHAGWRGTVADVVGETVRTMQATFGTRPEDLVGFIGPTIGPCCYEVGQDVVEAWHSTAGDGDGTMDGTLGVMTFDLARANMLLLERAGLNPDRVETSRICTRCAGDSWFSHRGQGSMTGRFAAVIAVRG